MCFRFLFLGQVHQDGIWHSCLFFKLNGVFSCRLLYMYCTKQVIVKTSFNFANFIFLIFILFPEVVVEVVSETPRNMPNSWDWIRSRNTCCRDYMKQKAIGLSNLRWMCLLYIQKKKHVNVCRKSGPSWFLIYLPHTTILECFVIIIQ